MCAYLLGVYTSYAGQAAELPQSSRSLSLPPKVWQWIEGERGDDEDDAGRCRSDARGQPSTAFVAAERVGGTVARAGVDIAREREKSLAFRPLLSLLEMEAALGSYP